MTFYKAQEGFSIFENTYMNFRAFCVAWDQNVGRESCRSKDNWRALKLDEVLISTCRSLRVITFHLHCLTRWQMFVTSRPPCWRPFEGHWPTWRPHTESPFHLGEEPFFRISREWKPHRPKSWRGCLYINPCFTDPMFLTDYFLWQYESENQQLQN